ncbi:MAG: SagB family peptide dehydrogenase [Actinobacteria bacterium]|nr:SagB family peptide dehydrogenase [Actinomycetota bacterium]
MSQPPSDATREFHTRTKLHEGASGAEPFGHPTGFRPMDGENRPTPFKRYPSAPKTSLPRDLGASQAPAARVLSGTAAVGPATFDDALLGRFLFYSAGVTRIRTDPDGWVGHFRAAPAAGNLHPVEIYAVCGAVDGVPAGIHHFDPGDFALEAVREGDRRGALAEAVAEDSLRSAPVSLVLTGVPWRTGWKYGPRGLRHVYWDAGSLLAQLLAIAEAAGVSARVHLGFVDSAISEELGLDGVSEFPVAVVTLGADAVPAGDTPRRELVAGEAEAISVHPFEFRAVTQIQHAGDLADGGEVERWRKAAASLGRPVADRIEGPPHSDEPSGEEPISIELLIRRRGSTRLFRQQPISGDVAAWCLGVASRPAPVDFCTPGSTLLAHHVSVHAVNGVASGRHVWNGRDFEVRSPEPADRARAGAQRLCLLQPLGGDSAFTVFHSVDLEAVLAGLGDRGYRAAQLEAGLAAGRLQLAAFAVGMGGTGLTFFDDAVARAFDTADACMLVTAVGPADYRNRPGGLPGSPVELSGFGPLMQRFQARFERDRT